MRVILTFILAFTCLLSQGQNFTNKGREFWVGYGHSDLFQAGNIQDMVVYLSAEQPANVTVSIPGTSWTKTYAIPANTVYVSDIIPKSGAEDCRLNGEGLYKKAVHIESNIPIVAYAHMYGNKSSGAAMLLPVETYGYTYSSINASQEYSDGCYSWFYVIASEDNTRIRITPTVKTMGGRAQRVPFDVNLKKGEIYNVLGYTATGGTVGSDVSGSKAISIPGADGKCHPITMFSGSSRTFICPEIWGTSGGDVLMQQVFPVTAWGARYLAAPTVAQNDPSKYNENRWRVYVSDPTTQVYANGNPVSGYYNGYYDYSSKVPQYITADKPIMVAQLVPSQGACNNEGLGDPEIIFLSPMEQAIKNVAFYSTNKENINNNFVSLTIHENGISSLKIDGSSPAVNPVDHPGLPGYKVVVQELANAPAQHTITSDSGFNAIAYGLGSNESYGYNAGCYINNLTYLAELRNELSDHPNTYTCLNTPFYINVKTMYPLTGIAWHFGEVPGITPGNNVIYTSPVLDGTEIVNGKTYNVYKQPIPASAAAIGTYYIPVTIQSPNIDNCSNTEKFIVELVVKAGPTADFTTLPVCATDTTFFKGVTADATVDKWVWDFGDETGGTGKDTQRIYLAGGNYEVTLLAGRSDDGCAIPVTKKFIIPGMPAAAFDIPAVVCMPGGESKFVNKTTMPGTNPAPMQYAWTFGDGNSSTSESPTNFYASSGTYPVTLIASTTAGCNDTTSITVSTFANRPKAAFDVSETSVCVGKPFVFTDRSTLTGNAAAATFKWTFGDGTAGSGATPSKLYKKDGSYPVSMYVISSEGCNSDTVTSQVTVYPMPVVNAGPDVITEPNRPIQLKATVSPVTANVLWTPPTGLSDPRQLQPMATLLENQWYVITATGDFGCTASDTMLVKVFKELKIPNAFTPNGDGKNDTWRIPGLEEYRNATVQVFNRWGQVVFKSVGYGIPWNGVMNGNQLPTGAYYYVIKPGDNGYGVLSGMVMIVR
ncbi:gliding motility-associated-like protein [Chitinophagaceae bacterium OAS944]|uniref:PKD domain-containing protein n=2 Tax=Niastella sp. OAS944 TaxID=2664089 RepID=UPI0035C78D6B|nr:gliding motility-associated-like protein [Chitinophagaceae bacterium OAS944]